MTKLIVETDNNWTKKKIKDAIHTEKQLLRKALQRSERKIRNFEKKYGKLERKKLYGKADDVELVEWEGEIETAARFKEQLLNQNQQNFLGSWRKLKNNIE